MNHGNLERKCYVNKVVHHSVMTQNTGCRFLTEIDILRSLINYPAFLFLISFLIYLFPSFFLPLLCLLPSLFLWFQNVAWIQKSVFKVSLRVSRNLQ